MNDNDESKHPGADDAADQELSEADLDAVTGGANSIGRGGVMRGISRALPGGADDLASPTELLNILSKKEGKTPSAQ